MISDETYQEAEQSGIDFEPEAKMLAELEFYSEKTDIYNTVEFVLLVDDLLKYEIIDDEYQYKKGYPKYIFDLEYDKLPDYRSIFSKDDLVDFNFTTLEDYE